MFGIKKKKIDWGEVEGWVGLTLWFLLLVFGAKGCAQSSQFVIDRNKIILKQQTKDSVSLAECHKNGVFTDECAEILSKKEIYGENYYEHMDAFQKEMDSFRKGTSND